MEKTIWVCSKCGSNEVQTAMWVNMNTLEPDGNYGADEAIDTNWCLSCEGHYEICTQEEYNEAQKEE